MVDPISGIGFVRAITNLVEQLGAGSTVDLQAISRLADKRNAVSRSGLPRGNAVFERVGHLLVNKLEREAFLEVSHHPGLDLAEHDHGAQRGAVFRGDRGP
jgi:hypothetical protein